MQDELIFAVSKQRRDMKRRTAYLLFAVISAVLWHGCQEIDEDGSLSRDGYVDFVFTGTSPESKADISWDGTGSFTDGDRVGLYVYGSPTKHIVLTMEDGKWTPNLRKSDLGTGKVILSAYYPARDDVDPSWNRHEHKVLADQSGDGYEASDLLWSHKSVDLDALPGNRIELPFIHGMHRLNINISDGNGTVPDDISVKIINETEGSYSIYLGTLNSTTGDKESITPKTLEKGRYSAVLFPSDLSSYRTGWVEISSGGKTAIYKAPDKIGEYASLQSGMETTLNLRLGDGSVTPDPDPDPDPGLEPDPEYAGKTCWVYGVNAPVYPRDNEESVKEYSSLFPEQFPEGVWFKEKTFMYLGWVQGSLWFDCDKDNPSSDNNRPGYHDSNLCWAASASDMIHWWMYHNRHYIEAYDRKYGNPEDYVYPRPSADFTGEDTGSEVFDLFRKICRNVGGQSSSGVNWFINGLEGVPLNSSNIDVDFNGYFTEIFDNVNLAVTDRRFSDKPVFNALIKEAFENDRAIGITQSIHIGGGSLHSMVVWGAEFGDDGYVSAIYYVDSNDHFRYEVNGGGDFQRHRCIRIPITYDESSGRVYMGTTKAYSISAVTTVDLGRDVWAAAFPDVPQM